MRLFLIIIPIIIILNSCSTTKHVPKNKHLLIRNNLKLIEEEKINKYEVKKILKQKPNKKIFGGLVQFHLGIYNLTDSTKNNFINRYFRKIGEKPVILDDKLTSESKLQIERYFKNKGYLNSNIKTKKNYKNQTAVIDYEITLGKCYTIQNIIYPEFKIDQINTKQEIKIGDPLDIELINNEAERITTILQNNGYFNFQKKSLFYRADTAFKDSVKLIFEIDSTNRDLNQKYYFRNINIIINQDSINFSNKKNSINFFNLSSDLKEKTIKQAIDVSPGELYSLKKIQQTRNNLSNLKIFKSIYISFLKTENEDSLDCNIFLKKQKKMYYRIEAEGTNSSGNYGTSMNFKFGNKNAFKRAENFNFKFKGALETRKNLQSEESFFNIWEIGGETSLKIPRLISPILMSNIKSPNTDFTFSFMKQQRPDFTRSILKTTLFGYNFKSNKNFTHFLNLIEFSYVKMFNESADFQEEYLGNQLLKNQYTDHLITGSSYTVIYNNQKQKNTQNYSFVKGRLEMSGLTTNLLANAFNFEQNNSGSYTLFENRFTQHIIGEFDLRKYFSINAENILVLRTYFGIGYPYGNSDQIPAQKQFFAGGSNGVRAWKPFSLGPGSYQNSENNIEYFLGDIKLESNIEYRFPLFKLGSYKMKGAIFADSGNIWYSNPNFEMVENQPGSKFEKDFLSEIAIGMGFGFRYDVNLLIIRLDLATPIRYPYKINNNNWVKNPFKEALEGNLNLNIGIGYPF